MLKKRFRALFQLGKTKVRFCLSSIFNDLLSLKMAAHPCAANRLSKNGVFQQPDNRTKNSAWSRFSRQLRRVEAQGCAEQISPGTFRISMKHPD